MSRVFFNQSYINVCIDEVFVTSRASVVCFDRKPASWAELLVVRSTVMTLVSPHKVVAAAFLAAFVSLGVQWIGLFGAAGITPAESRAVGAQASSVTPTSLLEALLRWSRISLDALAPTCCFAGAVLAATLCLAPRPAALGFAALTLLYSMLYSAGDVFLSFQWDILLLEVGSAVALASAFVSPSQKGKHGSDGLSESGRWLLRFAAFKLMLMSGVVKLTARCPTWHALTATDVHFASQCLPSPLSWWLHQSPPVFSRLQVAVTMLVEMPLTVLLLAGPFHTLARIGVWAQVALQLLIVATGNYAFFNVLTAALCAFSLPSPSELQSAKPGSKGVLAWFNGTARGRQLQVAAAVAYTAAVSAFMFDFSDRGPAVPWWDRLHLRMHPQRMSADAVNGLMDSWLPMVAAACAAGYALVCLRWLFNTFAAALDVLCCCCGRRRDGDTLRRLAAEAATAAAAEDELQDNAGFEAGAGAAAGAASAMPRVLQVQVRVHVPKCAPFKRRLRACCSLATAPLHVAACAAVFGASMVMLLTLRQQTCLDASRPVFTQALQRWSDGGATGRSHKAGSANGGLLASAWVKHTASVADSAWAATLHGGIAAYTATAPWHVTSGYGLFRSMTGVGPTRHDDATGLPYVTTERPEIIIEGLFLPQDLGVDTAEAGESAEALQRSNIVLSRAARSAAAQITRSQGLGIGSNDAGEGAIGIKPTDAWLELPLRFKPSGDMYARPGQVAPHQPRLDWQMWFAALGDYNSAPWLVRLVHLLLQGSPPAYALLDGGRYPVKRWLALSAGTAGSAAAAGNRTDVASAGGLLALVPPVAIRARLFHYDFTRADVPWGRQRVPPLDPCAYAGADNNTAAVTAKQACKRDVSLGYHSDGAAAEPFWQRRFVREYLPVVTRHEASLEGFCQQHGWSKPAFAPFGDASSGGSSAAAGSITSVRPVFAAAARGQTASSAQAATVSLPLGGVKSEARRTLLLGEVMAAPGAFSTAASNSGDHPVAGAQALVEWWRAAVDGGRWKRCRKAAARVAAAVGGSGSAPSKSEAGALMPLLEAAKRVARALPAAARACSSDAWAVLFSPPLGAAGSVARRALHTGVRAGRLMGLLPPGPGFVVPRAVVGDISADKPENTDGGANAAAAAALRAAGVAVSQQAARRGGFAMAADSTGEPAGALSGPSGSGLALPELPRPGTSVLAPLVVTGPAAAAAPISLHAAQADGGAGLPSAHASSLWWLVGLVGGKAVLEFVLALLADACGSGSSSGHVDAALAAADGQSSDWATATEGHPALDGRTSGDDAPMPSRNLRSQPASGNSIAAAATTSGSSGQTDAAVAQQAVSDNADGHANITSHLRPASIRTRPHVPKDDHDVRSSPGAPPALLPAAPSRDDRAAVRRFLTQGL